MEGRDYQINTVSKEKIKSRIKQRKKEIFKKNLLGYIYLLLVIVSNGIIKETSFANTWLPLGLLFLSDSVIYYLFSKNIEWRYIEKIRRKLEKKGRNIGIPVRNYDAIEEIRGDIGIKLIISIVLILITACYCTITHNYFSLSDTFSIIALFYTLAFANIIFGNGISINGVKSGIANLKILIDIDKNQYSRKSKHQNILFLFMVIVATLYLLQDVLKNIITIIKAILSIII